MNVSNTLCTRGRTVAFPELASAATIISREIQLAVDVGESDGGDSSHQPEYPTMRVPPSVPSVAHSSRPDVELLAVKNSVFPTAVSAAGLGLLKSSC